MDFDSFVLAAATGDLADARRASTHADAVEFRMDYAAEPLADLAEYDASLPIVATNRVDWEGGEAPDVPERLDVLEKATTHDAVGAIDVELAALEGEGECDANRVLEAAEAADVPVIVSTHDFAATPERDALVGRLERACEYGDVGKLAVTADDREDVLDLLRITAQLDDAGHTVATMAMGEAGRHSRAVAPLYGSAIGYAPVDPAEATAPGQYDLVTLRRLVDELRSRSSE